MQDIKQEFIKDFQAKYEIHPQELGSIADFWIEKLILAVEQEKERKISEMGFNELVQVAETLLKNNYPLEIFDGSSGDTGPRFTAKLHEALSIINNK